VTTVRNEVKELSKKYVDLETHTQSMNNIFDNGRSECSDNSKAIKVPLSLPDTTTVYGFQSLAGIAG
jgi:uncharacterized coiled-coil DUF342 family protein